MSIVISQAAVFCIFKDDFQNALRKTKCFSFVDLLYLAAEIDKHFLAFPLYSEFSLSFPSSLSLLPFSLPGHVSNIHQRYLRCWYLIISVTPLI